MTGAVLVTGATGFLGAPLVRALARAGREVHALARPSSERAPLAGLDVVWHAGALEEPASLARALAAASARGPADVVHSAALISYATADVERSWRVNVEGTRALLDAARAAGVRRFLHVSSVVAVGHAPDATAALDEDAPFNGGGLGVAYVTTKRAAEELALAAADALDVVVVNPGAIFGPSARPTNTIRFLRRLAAGRLGPLAPPGSLGVVGVDDVVDGCLRALERGARGRRFVLVESNWSLCALFAQAAAELGARAPRRSVPRAAWGAVVAAAALADRVRPLALATPQALRLLGLHFRFDAARARAELGWSPRPFAPVLAGAIEAARAHGWLAGGARA